MKISTFVMFLLVVSGVIFLFATMIQEGNTAYPNVNADSSSWANSYNYSENISGSISHIVDKFAVLKDPDTGFFSKIGAGLAAIPYAVILVPETVINSLGLGGNLVSGLLKTMGIPSFIIALIGVMIVVWAMFKLVEFFQRMTI